MMEGRPGQDANITGLLIAWGEGDRGAGEALAPILARELHRVAARYMAGEGAGHVLQTAHERAAAFLGCAALCINPPGVLRFELTLPDSGSGEASAGAGGN